MNNKNTHKIYGWVLENEKLNPTIKQEGENYMYPLCGFEIKACLNCGTEFTKSI